MVSKLLALKYQILSKILVHGVLFVSVAKIRIFGKTNALQVSIEGCYGQA